MGTTLVTGGTGDLGRPTVEQLRAAGHQVQVLSRKSAPGLVAGDLSTGKGIREAIEGADTVLHLATGRGRGDLQLTKNLIEAIGSVGIAHLILISIVGIDQIPLGFYRAKLEIERLVSASSIPNTILRSTQFFNLLDDVFTVQKWLPVLFAPSLKLQPIAVEDVAGRLTEIAASAPSGRVPDIGGPQQLTVPELARAWKRVQGTHRPVVPLRLPGKIFRAYASGAALVDGPAYGRTIFDDFLAARFGGTA